MSNVSPPYLALDFGQRFLGLAFSEAGFLSSELQTIDRREKSDNQIFGQMTEIIRKYEIKTLIVGLPISTDGSENEHCQKIRQFVQSLENYLLSTSYKLQATSYFPEDFSSFDVGEQFKQATRLKDKLKPDHSLAAKLILERFLEESKSNTVKDSSK